MERPFQRLALGATPMDALWQWGIGIIAAVQTIRGPAVDALFRAVSFLGGEQFYLILFPALLWCVDRRLGIWLGLLFLFSVYVNSLAKIGFAHPRPFELAPSLQIGEAEGPGLPSGHAQAAAVIWGGLALHVGRSWMWAAAALLAGAIGFSRIYLGVHFPTDVVGGWIIGIVLLIVWWAASSRAAARVRAWPAAWRIACAAAVPAVLALVFRDDSAVSAMGAAAGVGVGYVLGAHHLDAGVHGPWWQRAARFVVGGAVLALLYVSSGLLLRPDGEMAAVVARFLRYGALGLWISFGGPWMFTALRLSPGLRPRAAPAA